MLVAVVVLLWLGAAVLAVFVVLLYRQFGLIAMGSPTAVRIPGPRAGRRLRPSSVTLADRSGEPFTLDLRAAGRVLYLVFVGPRSGFDDVLGDALHAFSHDLSPDEECVVVSRGSLDDEFARRVGGVVRLLVDADGRLFRQCDVQVLPSMFVVDDRGVLVCRDLVNDFRHLAGLREDARELGPHERLGAGRK